MSIDENKIVFQVFACNNPISNKAIYFDVFNREIYEFCGVYFEQLTAREQSDIQADFNRL